MTEALRRKSAMVIDISTPFFDIPYGIEPGSIASR
jgi:hypothetical protein